MRMCGPAEISISSGCKQIASSESNKVQGGRAFTGAMYSFVPLHIHTWLVKTLSVRIHRQKLCHNLIISTDVRQDQQCTTHIAPPGCMLLCRTTWEVFSVTGYACFPLTGSGLRRRVLGGSPCCTMLHGLHQGMHVEAGRRTA